MGSRTAVVVGRKCRFFKQRRLRSVRWAFGSDGSFAFGVAFGTLAEKGEFPARHVGLFPRCTSTFQSFDLSVLAPYLWNAAAGFVAFSAVKEGR